MNLFFLAVTLSPGLLRTLTLNAAQDLLLQTAKFVERGECGNGTITAWTCQCDQRIILRAMTPEGSLLEASWLDRTEPPEYAELVEEFSLGSACLVYQRL